MGAPDPENPLFLRFSVLRGGMRLWSQTMVSEEARPWGRGRSEFAKNINESGPGGNAWMTGEGGRDGGGETD